MKPSTEQLLDKADRAIVAARHLLENDDAEFAVGRAYYAMFYVASALLDERGLRFRKHSGVHSAFGQHLVKTGEWDQSYHRWLLEAFTTRIVGDYEVEAEFTADEARIIVDRAINFLTEARRRLSNDD